MDYVIYIAGPMKGLPEFNYPAFNEAERLLREKGYDKILNPVNHANGVGTNLPYAFYIRESIKDVLQADAVCVLPNWEKSTGAKLEVHIGTTLGLPIYPLAELLADRTPKPLFVEFDVANRLTVNRIVGRKIVESRV